MPLLVSVASVVVEVAAVVCSSCFAARVAGTCESVEASLLSGVLVLRHAMGCSALRACASPW